MVSNCSEILAMEICAKVNWCVIINKIKGSYGESLKCLLTDGGGERQREKEEEEEKEGRSGGRRGDG